MYVYIRSEPQLYTIGFYDPDGRWHSDSDHSDRDEAARRVHFLNGGEVGLAERVEELERQLEVVNEALTRIESAVPSAGTLRCPYCGDDRRDKGSLIVDGRAFCNETHYLAYTGPSVSY